MEAMEYRRGGLELYHAWQEWKEKCPNENHDIIPFAAGYRAAINLIREYALKEKNGKKLDMSL